MKEKIIICSGDSYTAGMETAANKYFPGYTDLVFDIRSMNNIHANAFTKMEEIVRSLGFEEYSKYHDECKKNSWPAHLKKMSNIEVLNISANGISNHEIVHRAVKTYLHLLEKGISSEEIIVLCMLSSPARIGYPQHAKNHSGEYNFQSFMTNKFEKGIIGTLLGPNTRQTAVEDWYVSHNDWDMLWSSYTEVCALKTLMEYYKSRIYFFDSSLIDMFRISTTIDKSEKQYFENIIDSMNLSLKFKDVLHRELPMSVLPGCHPTSEGHEVFARNVWNLIL